MSMGGNPLTVEASVLVRGMIARGDQNKARGPEDRSGTPTLDED
jgi:hypothetical protein